MRQFFLLGTLLFSTAAVAQKPESASSTGLVSQVAVADAELDKKVCKKSVETGTLSKASKTCLTRRQWLAMSDENKQPWGDLQGTKGMTSGQ